ncbi:MAG: hypothetical protein A2Y71_10235 [Bacteroidetes bacterium RBG_13_42_15]|nr:MAG: hypothetical protein A2Y71_10235 [Bacteroidetes bacterium RBG_13_42_15]
MSSNREILYKIIDDIWVESCYNFDKQNATRKLTILFDAVAWGVEIKKEEPLMDNSLLELEAIGMVITDPESLLKFLTEWYHIPLMRIRGKSRKAELVKVRQVYCYIARVLWPYFSKDLLGQHHQSNVSLEKIGREINRLHADVLHGIKMVKQDMETNWEFNQEIGQLLSEIDKWKTR